MPDPQGLDVHDLVIAHNPVFDAQGRRTNQTQVTYSIGPHGPFVLTYDAGQATAEQIKGDIDRQIGMIRALTTLTAS